MYHTTSTPRSRFCYPLLPRTGNGNFLDQFNGKAYPNNDDTLPWATEWIEVGESDGHTSGDERVKDYFPEFEDNENGGEAVEREVDLSGAGFASLSFAYRRQNLDSAGDYVLVQMPTNGTSGFWTELEKIAGGGTDGSYVTGNYDITPYISDPGAI
ncbi:MAG: hypothetical protein ACE1ZA_08365, partial [Pseudomonadales bacterium]